MADLAPVATAPPTPQWLLQGEVVLCPCGCIGRRRKVSFVERTIDGGAALLRQVMFGEQVAAQRGLLQQVDPRAKLVGLFVMLLAAALLRNIAALAVVYLLTLVAAALSGLPLASYVKRVWLFVPLFTLVVVLPATLSIVTPGDVVVPLWTWHGQPQGFTAQGLATAALLVSRVAVSISLAVLLTLTTPWVRLLAALRALGVPRMFVLVIGMAYRYVFLLLGSVTEMYEARRARSVGAQRHDRSARSFLSATAGTLFGRSRLLSEQVHDAMVARGYRGDARPLQVLRFTASDLVFGLVVAGCAVGVLWLDALIGR